LTKNGLGYILSDLFSKNHLVTPKSTPLVNVGESQLRISRNKKLTHISVRKSGDQSTKRKWRKLEERAKRIVLFRGIERRAEKMDRLIF
jgi:hypothetical protein